METTKHTSARRKNIPTADLEGLVRDEERAPKTMLYPRHPELDPQLVWKGKDEQDESPLAVPAVPIYIQEKIAPLAIIEDLRAEKKRAGRESQLDLFGDFNGLPFEDLVQFYEHEQQWTNRMILGDSLLVMTSLAEKEGLRGQVQMIYVDPPYGIKFGSNWQVSTRRRDVRDGRAEDTTRQPEQVRAFRDTWALGVHSYLSYLRDRFTVARELLIETGSIFVQIGSENVHLVRAVMDEVFGSGNFMGLISFRVKSALAVDGLGRLCDYLVWYARDKSLAKYRQLYTAKEAAQQTEFNMVELTDGRRVSLAALTRNDPGLPAGARLFTAQNLASSGYTPSCTFEFELGGKRFPPPRGRSWKTTRDGMQRLEQAHRLLPLETSLRFVYYFDDFPFQGLTNFWTDTFAEGDKDYVVQTDPKVITRCMLMSTDPGDLVLDPTCGSGTTAYVAEQWGRRWITIDTSRVALALARTRLMAACYPYYLLRDTDSGVRKEAELVGQAPSSPIPPTSNDIRQGFVYQRVPHISLRSIANNPEIQQGMTRDEVDLAVARHADTEPLCDRPYIDNKIVRVAGPFTVESLSPHRTLPADAAEPELRDRSSDRFVSHILDNLRRAGVENSSKAERLLFDALDTWPGAHVQAMGDYTERGKSRRVAVSVGPEYGTVGVELVREAAKEAGRAGAETLVVCGFAFDPHVADEPAQYGRLTVLKAKMNPDLLMGDELLKKTGAGNLFMVFGEPDIDIRRTEDGQWEVEIRGLDVYDPTTGQVRSQTTDDIATWFIDTNYDGASFFVRHAYFLGADDPYGQLTRALRADVDEEAWQSLHRTVSRPFPRPETGKIALKVINHYGDEVLKVCPVE